jgi:tetratricopeptide (TPR) repeat protein
MQRAHLAAATLALSLVACGGEDPQAQAPSSETDRLVERETRRETEAHAWAERQVVEARANAERRRADEAAFSQAAEAWRSANPRPAISVDADTERILAEAAFQDKDLARSKAHYERALSAYPVWPEGNFNLALIHSALHEWSMAVFYMRRYLDLVPDAPDAKTSREQVIIWEDKAERGEP